LIQIKTYAELCKRQGAAGTKEESAAAISRRRSRGESGPLPI
jgi:hypothetical protein